MALLIDGMYCVSNLPKRQPTADIGFDRGKVNQAADGASGTGSGPSPRPASDPGKTEEASFSTRAASLDRSILKVRG
jgi:hypothetical protein